MLNERCFRKYSKEHPAISGVKIFDTSQKRAATPVESLSRNLATNR